MSDLTSNTHNAALKLGLRDLLLRSEIGPEWVFSSAATELLHVLWKDVAQGVDERQRCLPDGLEALSVQELEGYLVRVIRFPQPSEVAENYFAAVAYRPARRRLLFWKSEGPHVRYLVLEYGMALEGKRTVLGEWTDVGHLNYGDGPEATEDDFIKAIGPILTNERKPVVGYVLPRGTV